MLNNTPTNVKNTYPIILRFVLLLIFIPIVSFSQIKYEKRVEVELKNGYENEKIFEFGESGFLLQSSNKNKANQEREWNYQLYNTDLELFKEQSIEIASNLSLDQTFNNQNRNFTLFKNKKGSFSLVTYDLSNYGLTKVDGLLPAKCKVSQMVVSGDYAYFKCSIIKRLHLYLMILTFREDPFLYSINWKTGEQNPIPISIKGAKIKNTTLADFQLLESTNEIMLYIKVNVDKNNKETHIIKLDDDGSKLDALYLTKDIDKSIINVSALDVGSNQYFLTGTYSNKSQTSSEGIYFCKLNNNKIDFINFYEFSEFDNFLGYLPEKRRNKIEKKKAKKEGKGKTFQLSYNIAPHEIIERDDGFILIGEAYYPTYYTTSYSDGNTSYYTTTFDGYKYTHAFIAKFSTDGTLQWDQTFEMEPTYKPFKVKKFISIDGVDGNSLKLVFVSKSKIVTKVFSNKGEVLKDYNSEEIETLYKEDKIKTSFSNINYWYNNFFIAYGTQKIKNKVNKKAKRKRKVYFFSKISYE